MVIFERVTKIILVAKWPSKIGKVVIVYWSFPSKLFVHLGFVKLFVVTLT